MEQHTCRWLFALGTLLGSVSCTVTTDLGGAHYRFTVVHDPPAVDVGLNDGTIRNKALWTGYVIDHIAQLSQYANFKYDLFLASGDGPSCSAGGTASDWARQYLCAEEDTLLLNTTDAYWSTFYVTKSRMVKGRGTLFTSPFLSQQGLLMGVDSSYVSLWDKLTKIFDPFDVTLWLVLIGCTLFSSFLFWYIEQLEPAQNWVRSKVQSLESYHCSDVDHLRTLFKGRTTEKYGWATITAAREMGIKTISSTIMSLTSHSNMGDGAELSRVGTVFNMIWCFFALILVSAYTANLSAILTTDRVSTDVETLEQLEANFPALPMVWVTDISDAMNKLERGDCQAIVDLSAVLTAVYNGAIDLDLSGGTNYCMGGIDFSTVGSPLEKGLTDFAVGVAADLKALHSALNYWITQFRTCDPNLQSSICGPGSAGQNLRTIVDSYLTIDRCGVASTSANTAGLGTEDYQLGVENFGLMIGLVLCVGIAALIINFWVGETCLVNVIRQAREHGDLYHELTKPQYARIWEEDTMVEEQFNENPEGVQALSASADVPWAKRALSWFELLAMYRDDSERQKELEECLSNFFLWNDLEYYYVLREMLKRKLECINLLKHKAAQVQFSAMDEDEDGLLTKDEWEKEFSDMVSQLEERLQKSKRKLVESRGMLDAFRRNTSSVSEHRSPRRSSEEVVALDNDVEHELVARIKKLEAKIQGIPLAIANFQKEAERFEIYDEDQDGMVSKDEFEKMFKQVEGDWYDFVMHSTDKNDDTEDKGTTENRKQRLWEVKQCINYLLKCAIEELCTTHNTFVSYERKGQDAWSKWLDINDNDGDGSVTQAEWISKHGETEEAVAAFSKFDTDGDGIISGKEAGVVRIRLKYPDASDNFILRALEYYEGNVDDLVNAMEDDELPPVLQKWH